MSNSVESVAISVGKTAQYGGAMGAVVGGLTLSEIGVIVGIVVGVAGLLLTQYWAARRDRRERDLYEAKLSAIKGACDATPD